MDTDKPRPSGGHGDVYAPEMCNHDPEDGCMWCCQRCNYDHHWCNGCGTIVGHRDRVCDDCREIHFVPIPL